jgi:isopenicillin N synthase-like dioxygenase
MAIKENGLQQLPILDLSLASDPDGKATLLNQLHDALFNIGFLYVKNHGVSEEIISALVEKLPALFDQPPDAKSKLSKQNSPHFLGYSGFAEEVTLGEKDLREQFDFATELPVIWRDISSDNKIEKSVEAGVDRDFTKLYWRLRGPNQWPSEELVPGFRKAFLESAKTLLKC